MIDFFDKIFEKTTDKNKFLSQIRYYTIIRLTIKVIVNVLAPVYFMATGNNKNYSLKPDKKHVAEAPIIIVSLTSFPARIKKVWLVIETILRQTHKPDKIILWLSNEQFLSQDNLPHKLLNLINRGLEIRYVNNDIRSHKKYYYVAKEYSNDYILTIDDDIYYRSTMIEDLVNYSKQYPDTIICQFCKHIQWNKNELKPYIEWPQVKVGMKPNYKLFFGTGGGTLFPPNTIPTDTLNIQNLMKFTPTADDIWLNASCRLNRIKVSKTKYNISLLPVTIRPKFDLASINNGMGKNDLQIRNIREFYKQRSEVDPFSKEI